MSPLAGSYREDLHAQALAAVQNLLLRRARAAQTVAYRLGVDVAEAELGRPGLYDPEGQLFAEQFEYRAIRSLTVSTAGRVRVVMGEGLRLGLSEQQLTARLEKVVLGREGWLRGIARTEAHRAANWGRFSGWRQSGVVRRKMAVATIDERTRPDHLDADGEEVPLEATFTRGAARGLLAPPWGPWCRCTVIPVTLLGGPTPREREDRAEEVQELRDRLGLRAAATLSTFAAAAVRREVPGLRGVEDVHVAQMVDAWRRWPRMAARAIQVLRVREVRGLA